MKRNLLTLALVAGMATMAPALAMAQGQAHGEHGQHGRGTGDAAQAAPATGGAPAMMPGRPMMQGQIMRGPKADSMMMDGMMPMHRMHGEASGAGNTGHAAPSHAATAGAGIDMSASSIAFRAVNEAMHHGMNMPMTGDADVDFVRGMIAHHAGAIDMARIVQIFGADPEIAALAEEIIGAQETELAMMREWLARNAPDAEE